jgi:spore germination protein
MTIHVVQPGETIYSIANMYGVSARKIVFDNLLQYPDYLVTGQTIVITYPKETYTVQEGDSLKSIADMFDITVLQLLRNNPYLTDREYLFSGESIVISYNQQGSIVTNGYANPFINKVTLKKTLPFLTYLSIYNYRPTEEGEVIANYDDSELIEITKNYGVAPLMLVTTLSPFGEENREIGYNLLYNDEIQDKFINNLIPILEEKQYYGLNMSFQYLNIDNQKYYKKLLENLSSRLKNAGYAMFVTINPNIRVVEHNALFQEVDYSPIGQFADVMTFMQYNWGYNLGPPVPISSLFKIKSFLDYVITLVPPEKINIGLQLLGYNWELPYVEGFSRANALTINAALNLARNVDTIIQFDEVSQTPYYYYNESGSEHMVWFVDARSINSLLTLIKEYGLEGTGIWNVMQFYSQLWLIINSQYEIVKVNLEDKIS